MFYFLQFTHISLILSPPAAAYMHPCTPGMIARLKNQSRENISILIGKVIVIGKGILIGKCIVISKNIVTGICIVIGIGLLS